MGQAEGFISTIIQKLALEQDLQKGCFVFPNQRSVQTAYKLFAKLNGGGTWAPKCLVIEDLMSTIAELNYIDSDVQLLRLYQIYQQKSNKKEPFHRFSAMGSSLLADFNEFDQGLVDTEKLFSALKGIAELDARFADEKRSDLIEGHLKRMEVIAAVYPEFTAALLAEKQGYTGLVYRKAAEKVSNFARNIKLPHVFIGFNAFSAAEQKVVETLLNTEKRGSIFWDLDWDLVQNDAHEAGHFIRQYRTQWGFLEKQSIPSVLKENDHLLRAKRPITILDCQGVLAQCHAMASILNELESYDNTAVVLADETLLPAVIAHLPDHPDKGPINITMGEALGYTTSASLLKQFIQLRKIAAVKNGFVPRRLVLPFISHPLLGLTLPKSISGSKRAQIAYNELGMIEGFSIIPMANSDFTTALFEFLDLLPKDESAALKDAVLRARELQQNYLFEDLSIESFEELIFAQIRLGRFTYKGDPDKGLQIMGILETRNQTFKNVIVLSMNEGIIPKGKSDTSIVPHQMKRAFGLPTYKEKDAIYTYYFYRLIQKASSVYLTFNSQPGAFDTKEKSRFIYQLETHPILRKSIIYQSVYFDQSFENVTEDKIKKDQAFLDTLLDFAQKGFSPSSLSQSIVRPLDFYKRYLLGVPEKEEVSEMMSPRIFGNIIHKTLEILYAPHKSLTATLIDSIQTKLPEALDLSYQKEAPEADRTQGRGYLSDKVIGEYVAKTLLFDKKLCEANEKIDLLVLEKAMTTELSFPELSERPIVLKGFIDRVDQIGSQIRIVDYKTGTVNSSDLSITDLEELFSNPKKTKPLQLMCYALLLYNQPEYQSYFSSSSLEAGVYSTKSQSYFEFKISKTKAVINAELIRDFELELRKYIKSLFEGDYFSLEAPQ